LRIGGERVFQREDAAGELRKLPLGETREQGAERLDTATATLDQRVAATLGRLDPHRPGVVGIGGPGDVPVALEAVDQAGHRRRLDLLQVRELADAQRSGEDEHRERGEARGGDAQRLVFHAQAAQQVDRGGVQPIRHRVHVSRWGSASWRGHRAYGVIFS